MSSPRWHDLTTARREALRVVMEADTWYVRRQVAVVGKCDAR